MLDAKFTSETGINRDGSCDVRIWSKECEHTAFKDNNEKYMCEICEKIPVLDHEVRRAALPYVSGDYDNLY